MENHVAAQILITFGGLFLLGLIADLVGRHTPLPRVTLLLLSGFLIGPSVLDLLPSFTDQWFPVLTNIALAMIGFMLGKKMTRTTFHNLGRAVFGMSTGVVLATASLVFVILFLFGSLSKSPCCWLLSQLQPIRQQRLMLFMNIKPRGNLPIHCSGLSLSMMLWACFCSV